MGPAAGWSAAGQPPGSLCRWLAHAAEPVTDTSHGLDPPRTSLVRIELAPEVRHVHLYGSLPTGVIGAPEVLDELFRGDLAAGREEQGKDAMLGRGELDPPSCDEGPCRREVDGEVAGGDRPITARARHGPRHADDGRRSE